MNLKQKFKKAIKLGTGETHLLIKENPAADFSKEIIKAAVFNFAYDAQSEGSRGSYIAELINLSGQKDAILLAIHEVLKTEVNDNWGTRQLFDIAAIFAKEGDERSKKAAYECFYEHTLSGEYRAGQDSIVEIDGLKGLLFVAETVGRYFTEDPEGWEDSFLVDYFQEQNPAIDVYEELRKAARDNPYTKRYLETIEAHKRTVRKRKKLQFDYQAVKEKIDDKETSRIFSLELSKLSKNDVKGLADDFLKETERSKQLKYLHIFSEIEFPYNHRPILELAKSKNNKNDAFVYFAVESLKFFKAKDIRQFALDKLSAANEPETYSDLLIKNYKKGDWKLLKSLAAKYRNDDRIHSLGASYIDIYKTNPTKECKEPLEMIYNKMNCGLHRWDLVKILIENDVISDKIRTEIQFDCDEDTRQLFVAN
jgi:hypothetical protein